MRTKDSEPIRSGHTNGQCKFRVIISGMIFFQSTRFFSLKGEKTACQQQR